MLNQYLLRNPGISRVVSGLMNTEIILVSSLVIAGFLSTRLLPVCVFTGILFAVVRWLTRGRLSRRTRVDWAIVALLLMIPITLWVTVLPEKTLVQVYRLLSGIALFYAIVNWGVTANRLKWIELGLIMIGLGLGLFALIAVQWGEASKVPFIPSSLYKLLPVRVSDAANPNVMAGTLVILLPIPLAWLAFTRRQSNRWERLLVVTGVLVMFLLVVLTQSRGGWMGLAAGILTLIVLRWKRGWIAILFMIILAGLSIYWLGSAQVLDLLVSSKTLGGVDGRIEVWSRAIFMIQDFPLTGVGMGTFGDVADIMYPFYIATTGSIYHAHNLFLQVAVDMGLPGLLAWVVILGVIIWSSVRVYISGRKMNDAQAIGLGASLLASQVALVIHGMTDAVTWGMVRPAPLVWALWGLVIAAASTYDVKSPD